MIDRAHVEKFLVLNGVSPSAPDDEIKSVLISASWHENDVEAAIMVLRQDRSNNQARIDSVQQVFRSDERRLKPEVISSLLGITMDVTSQDIAVRRSGRRSMTFGDILRLIIFSITLSGLSLLFLMWYFEVGMFHIAVR